MTHEQIYNILKDVVDPEIPVISISELGILKKIELTNDNKVLVFITPTYNGCPAMDMITVQIKSVLQDYGYNNVDVISMLEPVWTTDWITDIGRQKLMEYGISPPSQKSTDSSFLEGTAPDVICPQCKSKNTTMISRFGSTACKALYKCNDCLEPFDYFKCH